jgi:predicted peptidase
MNRRVYNACIFAVTIPQGADLMIRSLIALCVLGLVAGAAHSSDKGFTDRVFKDKEGKEHKYVLFVPHEQKDTPAPLILFLHGAGERAGGMKMPAEVGIGPAIKKYPEKDFPFYVIIPQCDRGSFWRAESPDCQRALGMVEEVQKAFKTDEKRLYLTGLSMGGMGTWSLAEKYPEKWAAIAPICGAVFAPRNADAAAKEKFLADYAAKIKHIPCWCFHGDKDTAVHVDRSREIIEALKKAGSAPKYTEYPGVAHNSWDAAYGTKELYTWLLEQKLK